MGDIQDAVKRFKNGDERAVEDLFLKMRPLIYKLARKLHFMEEDDAVQELSLMLVRLISKLDENRSEGECVNFISESLDKYYVKLCSKYCCDNTRKNIELSQLELEPQAYNFELDSLIFEVDFSNYLEQIRKSNLTHAEILRLSIFEGISDQEIGRRLNFTRQYVHRIRMMLLKKYVGRGKQYE